MLEKFKAFILSLPPEFLVSGVIGSIITFFVFLHFIRKTEKEEIQHIVSNILTTEESIKYYAERVKNQINSDTFFYNYKEYLSATLKFVENYLGALKTLSYSTWEKHFIFSFIYSFFFFYIVWLFGGDGKIGELAVFPNENRLFVSLFLIFEIVLSMFFLAFLEKKNKKVMYLRDLIKKIPFFSRLNNRWQKLIIILEIIIAAGVLGVLGIVVGKVIIVTGLVIVGIILGVSGVLGVMSGIVIGGVILGGVVVERITPITILTILSLLFLLILPFVNSIFDYLSMYFSRKFAYNILETNSKKKIFFDIFVDTLIAIALLILLAITLFHILEYVNHFIYDEKLKLPIEYYKTVLLTNPFDKSVLWITLMFVSTLVPTFVHVILGLYSLLAIKVSKPYLEKLVQKMLKLSKNPKIDALKYEIAKELVLHEQSTMRIIYSLMAIGIFIFFILTLLALLLKIGIPLF